MNQESAHRETTEFECTWKADGNWREYAVPHVDPLEATALVSD